MRQLKGLDDISLSVVSPLRDDDIGWHFADAEDAKRYGSNFLLSPSEDKASGQKFTNLVDLYLLADSKYTGNVTTPVLYDSKAGKIISNDSWDIVRYLDRAFVPGASATVPHALYPAEAAEEVDKVAQWVQDELNNGVYMAGLAKTQPAYEKATSRVFACLDKLEKILGEHRFLAKRNTHFSVADIQLLATLVRFDDVYFSLFKCYTRRISAYYNITNYLRDMVQVPGVADTIHSQQVRDHYFTTFTSANPNGVVPLGTVVPSFLKVHDRNDADRFPPTDDSDKSKTKNFGKQTEEDQTDKTARQAKGEFVRGVSAHRNVITPHGTDGTLPAVSGRYHLYIANNCPWCHRVMLARAVLGLEDVISVDVMFYRRDEDRGWQFLPPDSALTEAEIAQRGTLFDGNKVALKDSVNGKSYIREIYEMVGSTEKSVPVLFDKHTNEVVNNESAEIIRMFATGFVNFSSPGASQLYPAHLTKQIDALNAWIYPDINNGAYKAGFSSNQATYEGAFLGYFSAWDKLEKLLSGRRFLTGSHVTEADIRLFPTICRHDAVYFNRMKLNQSMVADYPMLNRWLQDMYEQPGVKAATNMDHCIRGYFGRTGNRLVPLLDRASPWY